MSEVTVIERTKPSFSVGTGMDPSKKSNVTKKLRVAAYCRVSTEMEEQLGSFKNQVKTYKDMIAANPEWQLAGIYADEGISGTRADKRPGFQQMMEDCKAGKIDMVITKSISRFARNVVDSLSYTRELKSLGVSIYFEEEHMNSMDSNAEMLFTILSAVAEQESRNISEHTKWGIRHNFKRGIYQNPAKLRMYGFAEDKDGKVILVEDEADVVRAIYKSFLEGMGVSEITEMLNGMGLTTKFGHKWRTESIRSILINEKYKGDVLLQKNCVQDFITHKAVKNEGQEPQYYIKDAHPAIVDRDTWEAVQEELQRRRNIKDPNGKPATRNRFNSYTSKVYFKNGCQMLLTKSLYGHHKNGTWGCRYCKKHCSVCLNPYRIARMDGVIGVKVEAVDENRKDLPKCDGFSINDQLVKKFFQVAWNSVIDDNLQASRIKWTQITKDEKKTALQRVRAKQMLELTAAGDDAKLEEDVPEIVRMVLDRIEVIDQRNAEVYFLDGTMQKVQLASQWY